MQTARWVNDVWCRGLKPDPALTVSEWADRYRILAGKASSEPGPWRTDRTPYLRGVMDALSPSSRFERVVFMKGAQIGGTEAGNNWLAFLMHYAPGPVMAVQPTVEGAKRWSRQRVDPLIELPPLRGLVKDPRSRDSGNTTLMKEFPGGVLIITGANSAVGLRSMPVRYLFLDEVDGYPADADGEGDPVDLAVQRTATFGRRKKIFMVSTPTVAGLSRVDRAYAESDQRRFWVPCPDCGEFQVLSWPNLHWPEGRPHDACYVCEHCGSCLPNAAKARMLPQGEWRAEAEGDGRTAGFHLSALYSPPGWLSWGDIAADFVQAKSSPPRLQVFINTKLGETWQERGEAPEWERLFERREAYPIGRVPAGGLLLTAGVDVQKDRIEAEVVAWGAGMESWSVTYEVIMGDVTRPEVWRDLDRLLHTAFETETGGALTLSRLAIDTGYETQTVYAWARRHGPRLVMPVKGMDKAAVPVGSASPVDITLAGRKIRRGLKIWPVGAGLIKSQLYGWLGLGLNEDGTAPPGYAHFPAYEAEYFKMLTAEQLMRQTNRAGYAVLQWQKMRPRNEALDCRVYALAAALALGADRWPESRWRELEHTPRELALAPATPAIPMTPPAQKTSQAARVDVTPPPAVPLVIKSPWMEF